MERRRKTVGGIIVMRCGQNAFTVIDGVEQKLAQIQKLCRTVPKSSRDTIGRD
jgi:Cu/Ag efflux pump CusA